MLLTAEDSHINGTFVLIGQLPPWRHKLHNFGRALEVLLISHGLIAELFRGQFFVPINLPVWRKCKYMQGKIASRGAGIVFRLRVEKSTFESSLAYITLRLSLNQLRLLAVSLCIGVYSTSVLKKQLFSTCKIHLPFKACLFHVRASSLGVQSYLPLKTYFACMAASKLQHVNTLKSVASGLAR